MESFKIESYLTIKYTLFIIMHILHMEQQNENGFKVVPFNCMFLLMKMDRKWKLKGIISSIIVS